MGLASIIVLPVAGVMTLIVITIDAICAKRYQRRQKRKVHPVVDQTNRVTPQWFLQEIEDTLSERYPTMLGWEPTFVPAPNPYNECGQRYDVRVTLFTGEVISTDVHLLDIWATKRRKGEAANGNT